MSLNFLRKTVMGDSSFSSWDDFVGTLEGMADKGIVELYVNEDGEETVRLTEKGKEMAEMIKIREIAKDVEGIKKYRKSENRRSQSWG